MTTSRPARRSPVAWLPVLALAGLALAVGACGGPVLANPPADHPIAPPESALPSRAPDPQPVLLPRDDAPHDRLTEWWYYTGHLTDETGGRWGFEDVVFRAERGGFPVSWASHLALTDETGRTFRYAQRSEIGPQVDVRTVAAADPSTASGAGASTAPPAGASPASTAGASPAGASPAAQSAGFAFAVRGLDATDPTTFSRAPWSMAGSGGSDTLVAVASAAETQGGPVGDFGIDLALEATQPAVLHGGDGWIDFGPAGGSYYYSRTAMTATGTLQVGDRTLHVDGSAWFDHQWGDFISVGAGGWDWFAANLDDGTAVTLSLIRAADGSYPLVYGTLVDASGAAHPLAAGEFSVTTAGTWTSPATGATYPAGWSVSIPGSGLRIDLAPTVADQELDTRATTGVVYWEGSQVVSASRDGRPLGGRAYVELTGYAGRP